MIKQAFLKLFCKFQRIKLFCLLLSHCPFNIPDFTILQFQCSLGQCGFVSLKGMIVPLKNLLFPYQDCCDSG